MVNLERFQNVPFEKRNRCVVCEAPISEPVIRFSKFPLTEIYVEEKPTGKLGLIDQEFCLCERCGHGQLSNVIKPEFVYQGAYETRTSTSSSATKAINVFIEFINSVIQDRQIKTVVEIGCNDLFTLERFKSRAQKLYGIDPIWIGRECDYEDEKITAIGGFVEDLDLSGMNIDLDVVLCSHTLEHLSEPGQVIKKLMSHANDKSLFFFQFPGLESLVRDSRFDQVFHQHLNYFSLKSVKYMLEEAEAELVHFRINPYHWGTLMIAFKPKGAKSTNPKEDSEKGNGSLTREKIIDQYAIFKDSMSVTSRRLRSLKDEKIYGFGAALMLPVLDYHLEDGLSPLIGILDEDQRKIGKYYLNVPLGIIHPEKVENIQDCVFLLTAINSLDAGRKIIPRLMELNVKQIIVPENSI